MDIEKQIKGENKVVVDTKELAANLSFLIGRTILYRPNVGKNLDPNKDLDVTFAAGVAAVRVEKNNGLDGRGGVSVALGTGGGWTMFRTVREMNNVLVVPLDGDDEQGVRPLGEIVEEMGIYF